MDIKNKNSLLTLNNESKSIKEQFNNTKKDMIKTTDHHIKNKYSAKNIKILKGVEAIKKLPSMYIGSVGAEGKFHILKEIIDNSIDEHMSGLCNKIIVKYFPDIEKFIVYDNGRGLPHGDINIQPSMFEIISTTIHAGGKFNEKNTDKNIDKAYKYSGGKHGVGMSATNALSKYFCITTFYNNISYTQTFENGISTTKLSKQYNNTSYTNGTEISFIPGDVFHKGEQIVIDDLINYLKEKQYINEHLELLFYLDDKKINLLSEKNKGLAGLFDNILHKNKFILCDDTIYSLNSKITIQEMEYNLIFGYVKGYNDFYFKSFVNNIETPLGGTHINIFLKVLTSFLQSYIEQTLNTKIVSTNLILIFTCKLITPDFANQTKTKLNNKDILKPLKNDLLKFFTLKLGNNQNILDQIKRNLLSKKRAEELKVLSLETNKKIFNSGQLKDCLSKNFEERELFIVEGRSAGGTAVNSRNKLTQAVLTLRGKLLNVLRATKIQLLRNKEIKMIMSAMGIIYDVKQSLFMCEKPKYKKIIIAADADPDGKHIQLLFLTMIFLMCPNLISNGYVYVANTPLFRIANKKQVKFFFSKTELTTFLEENREKYVIQRFKGLGEMNPEQLRETTFDIKKRILTQISIDDIEKHKKTLDNFMGKDSKFRKNIIEELFE